MTERVDGTVGGAQEAPFESGIEDDVQDASSSSDAVDPVVAVQRELQQAREEAAANYDKFLRARADMENYKRRVERDYADLRKSSKREVLGKLLTVKDNLERALHYGESASANSESIIEGVRLTQYQLDSLLQGEGVQPIEAEGTIFDPHRAEAIQRVNDPSVPDHTVVQVVRPGYTFGDDVLRPAQVVVSVHGDDES
jgi:molecular chaperone GrpE